MTKEEKQKIIEEGLIVFDTCSLGRIYLMTRDAQKNLVEILTLLEERIWLPAQVKLEFSVHHNELRYKALNSCYEFGKTRTHVDDYLKSVSCLQDRLRFPEFHPNFSQDASEKIDLAKKQIEEAVTLIENIKNEQWNRQKELINKAAAEDDLFHLFTNLRTGEGYSIDELIAIASEGERRYDKHIPPGYADRKDKHGIQQYGDLILWKEILREAKCLGKDVLFVSDDVKEDWNVNKTESIRPELEREFESETGHKIIKLRLEDFIKELELASKEKDTCLPIFEGLELVRYQLQKEANRKERAKLQTRWMTLCCDKCHHEFDVSDDELCMEFESDGYFERNMGPEYAYCANEVVVCPQCGKQIDLKLHVWEYPVGAFNYQEIEAEGAEVVEEMNLEDCIPFSSEDFDTCLICGERKELLENMDICYGCYQRKMEELGND